MNHRFCPLLPKDELRGPVLVIVAHPDDEVIGAGGLLAWHSAQGHSITVVHCTDGAKGDPQQREQDIQAVRRREGAEALARLGIGTPTRLDLPDGGLPEHRDGLQRRLREVIAAVQPTTLYTFQFAEAHRDHRAVAAAVAAVADAIPAACRCLLFGVNQMPICGTLFDTTAEHARKRHALEAYRSQLAYIDFAAASDHRDRSATVNVDIAGVTHGELFMDLRRDQLARAAALCEELQAFLLGGRA